MADHIKPHKGVWVLFCSLENLWGICSECHSIKTAKEDGGWGNKVYVGPKPETGGAVATGAEGKQFQSSTVGGKLDKALDFDARELLDGIPE